MVIQPFANHINHLARGGSIRYTTIGADKFADDFQLHGARFMFKPPVSDIAVKDSFVYDAHHVSEHKELFLLAILKKLIARHEGCVSVGDDWT
jgi:hypothetical protein